ncbi:MAG: carbohydrate porin [Mariprofundaceae bacterium]|nr:carbohydrate porin [Mariprofundaceae bacterium]
MNRVTRLTGSAVAAILLLTSQAVAGVTIEAGTTIVGQQTSKQNNSINRDVVGSIDLVMGIDVGAGRLHIYGEGSSTPATSASTVIAGANADAGTAVDRDGKGRIQLSGIAYGIDFDPLHISIGIQDLTIFADATAVSNDETSQFLADSLVNNPAIAFPDYTPSVIFNYGGRDAVGVTVMVGNGYGLGDNPDRSYAELLKFGREKSSGLKKGLFTLAELHLPGEVGFRLGGWGRSSELPQHLGGANRSRTFGVYANADGAVDEATLWSARLGWNNAKATDETISHASLAIEHSYAENHLIALGVAWNGLSSDFKSTFTNAANPVVAELYYRWQINDYVAISPDVQYRSNTNALSATTAGTVGGSTWVYGLRVQVGASHQAFHAEAE